MSNIGKQPIPIPDGVEITLKNNDVNVKGKLGDLSYSFESDINIAINNQEVIVTRDSDEKKQRELHGLTRVLLFNTYCG